MIYPYILYPLSPLSNSCHYSYAAPSKKYFTYSSQILLLQQFVSLAVWDNHSSSKEHESSRACFPSDNVEFFSSPKSKSKNFCVMARFADFLSHYSPIGRITISFPHIPFTLFNCLREKISIQPSRGGISKGQVMIARTFWVKWLRKH